jgi:hypothetical protein
MVLFVLLLVLLPVQTQAQAQPQFAMLEIDLWPEYDQPAMLVVYKIELSPSTTFPVDLALRIPVDAGEPSAVAVGENDDSLFNVDYIMDIQDQWTYVRVKASVPVIRLEYYDPRITKDGASRHFEYTWLGDYSTDHLLVQVQQPLGATDLVISPGMEKYQSSSDGALTYYESDFGPQGVGAPFKLTIDYKKSTDELSVVGLKVQPVVPVTQNTPGRVTWLSLPLIIVLVLGLGLVVSGGLLYSRSRGREISSPIRKRRKAIREVTGPDTPAEETVVYCHTCGKRANPDDRFCRICGTRLRVG